MTANTTRATTAGRTDWLRLALQADGAVEALLGTALIVGAGWFAARTGLDSTWLWIDMGIVLLGFAFFLFRTAAGHPPAQRAVNMIIASNVSWVVIVAVLLLGGWLPLTTFGKGFLFLTADLAGTFALAQWIALRRAEA